MSGFRIRIKEEITWVNGERLAAGQLVAISRSSIDTVRERYGDSVELVNYPIPKGPLSVESEAWEDHVSDEEE